MSAEKIGVTLQTFFEITVNLTIYVQKNYAYSHILFAARSGLQQRAEWRRTTGTAYYGSFADRLCSDNREVDVYKRQP